MGVGFRSMRPGQEDAVAAMIRQLPKDIGIDAVPKITGESLRAASDLIQVSVADDSGLLLGCCVWMPVYSTWRGAKGVYICDLFVMKHARGKRIGQRLVQFVAKQAKAIGASYIRLEANAENPRASEFYERLGFLKKADEQNHFMEQDALDAFAGEKS
jgi:ribosomal protein S18 acetylase RimI-like enzyme